ncbi:peroxide stress protein YaaA [Streptococcus oricebi]|uniref:UPF0246 protein C4K46_00380 n=1 Tax=Streptococcus oricebi TaxID=1547447 RepID=A0ABS5B0N0_9STRE|nr:peroxide stress protein YaaA [Streptococcus oricebi]MBP2622392.1 peroxide stress protein YaaA [Streptococcus oricebi]
MKILIPTAKEMNVELGVVQPQALSAKSQTILDLLKSYSPSDLTSLYKISPQKAQLEYQHIQDLASGQASHYPALLLFDGLMYRHIKREDWTKAQQAYIEKHLLITSSLYGVLPALSPIAPHRLDFMVKLRPQGQSLKKFWQETYGASLQGEDLVLSLLSSEFESVFPSQLRKKFFTCKFMEEKTGQLKIHSTISKKARGQFLSRLIELGITEIEPMKDLEFAGFSYRADLSSPQELVYVRSL